MQIMVVEKYLTNESNNQFNIIIDILNDNCKLNRTLVDCYSINIF
jgi:hypothetical protein